MTTAALHAGPLALVFDPTSAAVSHVCAGGHTVLRGITAPVRDHAWATIMPILTDVAVQQRSGGFEVIFTARCRAHEVDFRWRGKLVGSEDGSLEFAFDGEALATFRRNRIGFCILHPAGAAGAACVVEHTDGRMESGQLPREISPHQPFFDIRAITHEFGPQLRAEVRMEGETFEMEDQRNWTDASFKTYCTPLARPYPQVIERGARVQQRVTLKLLDTPSARPRDAFPWEPPSKIDVEIEPRVRRSLPKIGTMWNVAGADDHLISRLRPLGLSHLRIDLRLADDDIDRALSSGCAAAAALGAQVELAIFVDHRAEAQLHALVSRLPVFTKGTSISRWIVFDETKDCTPPALISLLRKFVAGSSCAAPIGGGATDNFTELNREPAVGQTADFTVHACNPQVHAFDDESIIETLEVQGTTVHSARRQSPGRPIIVSPVTFTPRWRPDAAGAPVRRPPGLMPFVHDPRHASAFAGAWTVGSIAALAEAGAACVTYYEVTGPNGLMAADGSMTPAAKAIKAINLFRDAAVIASRCSHPLWLAHLVFEQNGGRQVILANLRSTSVEARVSDEAVSLGPHEVRIFQPISSKR